MNRDTILAMGAAAVIGAAVLLRSGANDAAASLSERAEQVRQRLPDVPADATDALLEDAPRFVDDPTDGNAASESPSTLTDVATDAGSQARRVVASASGNVFTPDQNSPANNGGTVPSTPAPADQGESANHGAVEEAAEDDLNERSASSNLSGDDKAAFDRLANADSAQDVRDYGGGSSGSSSGGSSGGSSDGSSNNLDQETADAFSNIDTSTSSSSSNNLDQETAGAFAEIEV